MHDDEPDEDIGMWIVQPDTDENGEREVSVVHLDCLLRGAHLLPVYGDEVVFTNSNFAWTLDSYCAFLR